MKRDIRMKLVPYEGSGSVPAVWQRTNRDPRLVGGNEALDSGKVLTEATRTPLPAVRYRSLLVPVDGTAFGEHALPLALSIARRAQATVQLVYVHSPYEAMNPLERLDYSSTSDAWQRLRQKRYLADLVKRLAAVSSVPVTTTLITGRRIASSLCAAAHMQDLVVMATHRNGPWQRLWNGSIADVLMRKLSIPIVFASGSETPVALAEEPRLRRLLVPLDGTAFAEQVLEPAQAISELFGAKQTLLRVMSDWKDDLTEFYTLDTATRLGGARRGVDAQTVVDNRSTANAILRFTATQKVDLIALATHARGGLSRLLHGSVAERVVRDATVPVLVFRPTSEDDEKKR